MGGKRGEGGVRKGKEGVGRNGKGWGKGKGAARGQGREGELAHPS